MYFEDVDFCLRAHQKGRKVVYHPACRVLHHIGGSSRKDSARMFMARHRSNWRYYTKHFSRNPFKDAFVAAGLFLRCSLKILLTLFQPSLKTKIG